MQIENQFYKATFDSNGKYNITPKIPSIAAKKVSGKETPRYPVIVEYEHELKHGFDVMLNSMVGSIGKILDTV